jgi:tetratricopeptide (TPR) repeat protein
LNSTSGSQEALQAYDKALEINSRHAGAWYEKGRALWALKRWADARYALHKALALGVPEAREVLDMIRKAGH